MALCNQSQSQKNPKAGTSATRTNLFVDQSCLELYQAKAAMPENIIGN